MTAFHFPDARLDRMLARCTAIQHRQDALIRNRSVRVAAITAARSLRSRLHYQQLREVQR